MLLTPLEQFQVISFFSSNFFRLDFSLTNVFFVGFLAVLCLLSVASSSSEYSGRFLLIPNNWQTLFSLLHETAVSLVSDNTNKEGEQYPLFQTFTLGVFCFSVILLQDFGFPLMQSSPIALCCDQELSALVSSTPTEINPHSTNTTINKWDTFATGKCLDMEMVERVRCTNLDDRGANVEIPHYEVKLQSGQLYIPSDTRSEMEGYCADLEREGIFPHDSLEEVCFNLSEEKLTALGTSLSFLKAPILISAAQDSFFWSSLIDVYSSTPKELLHVNGMPLNISHANFVLSEILKDFQTHYWVREYGGAIFTFTENATNLVRFQHFLGTAPLLELTNGCLQINGGVRISDMLLEMEFSHRSLGQVITGHEPFPLVNNSWMSFRDQDIFELLNNPEVWGENYQPDNSYLRNRPRVYGFPDRWVFDSNNRDFFRDFSR